MWANQKENHTLQESAHSADGGVAELERSAQNTTGKYTQKLLSAPWLRIV